MITVDIAGLPIRFENRYAYMEQICRDYQTAREPVAVFSASDDDLKNEKSFGHPSVLPPYLESGVLHRKAADFLPFHDGVFCHGAVIVVKKQAYLFTAKSGVGKTTHMNLWLKNYPEESFVLNGDKPALRFHEEKCFAYGTPWRGKEEYGCPGAYPLAGIVFLHRGRENTMQTVSAEEGLRFLPEFIYMPQEKTAALATLAISAKMFSKTPLYRLDCNMEDDAARVAYRTLIS